MIKLFDVENKVVVPTEHCYNIAILKDIMDTYPKEYMKVYSYLFYMSCYNPDYNPHAELSELDKEEIIMKAIQGEFNTDDALIMLALEYCQQLYETPISRAYNGIKSAIDKIGTYMKNVTISDGKEGNINQVRAMAKDYEYIRQSFMGAYKELRNEQKSKARGEVHIPYDQR